MSKPHMIASVARRVFSVLVLLTFVAGCASSGASTEQAGIKCRDKRVWGTYLRADKKAGAQEIMKDLDGLGVTLSAEQREAATDAIEDRLKWRMIRYLLLEGENHNYGQVVVPSVKTASGAPLVIHRTGITARPDADGSCFHSLVHEGGVRHAINLYSGDIDTRDLDAGERKTVEAAGGTYYAAREQPAEVSSWRHELRDHPEDPAVRRKAMQVVANLINQQILRPGGAAPRGAVHVHCGGGMHRTGMVVGVMERCLNGADASTIEAHLQHHTAYQSSDEPGGYETENLQFIMGFDCSLIQP